MTDWEKRLNEAAAIECNPIKNGTGELHIQKTWCMGANWSRQQDLELRKETLSVLALVEECLTGLRPVVTVLPRLVALREKVRACGHD